MAKTIIGSDYADVLIGTSGQDYIYGYGGNDYLSGGGSADYLSGGSGNDYLHGGSGNDVMVGGSGNDTLVGGVGADALYGGIGTDFASYTDAGSGVTASLENQEINTGDAKGDIFSSIEGLSGSAHADRLYGDHRNNVLYGNGGNDRLYGRDGDDTLSGDAGKDVLDGGDGDDMLLGGADNDTLRGGAGSDRLYGGSGHDTASYGTATSGVVASLATPSMNTGDARGDFYSSVEGLSGSRYADVLIGNSADNTLYGGFGDDELVGGAGADKLIGSFGADYASYTSATQGVTALLYAPNLNKGDAKGDTYSSIEGLLGSQHDDTLGGNGFANELRSGNGNDILIGDGGADILDGGAGYDTASYVNAEEGVVASLTDSAINAGDAAGDMYIAIEALRGSAHDDWLYGDAGANGLSGWYGDDRLIGFAGNDAMNGQAGDDVLYGGEGADTLIGGSGNDILVGGVHGDTMQGGSGFDYASYVDASSGVYADLGDPSWNVGDARYDTYDSIEGLRGSQFADTLIGDSASNIIYGDSGSDMILGRGGDDTLYGGIGNDQLRGEDGNDTLYGGSGDDKLLGGEGADRLDGGLGFDFASYATATERVRVYLDAPAYNIGSAAEGDTFQSIEGLIGTSFDDRLYGSDDKNVLHGRHGDDFMRGRSGNDDLYGDSGNDTLLGDAGKDILNGGTGRDYLYGGWYGHDVYVFDTALSANTDLEVNPHANVDVVEFNTEYHRIWLDNAIFRMLGEEERVELSASMFRANAGGLAEDADDHILYDTLSGNLYYDADGSGAGERTLFAELQVWDGTVPQDITHAHFAVV